MFRYVSYLALLEQAVYAKQLFTAMSTSQYPSMGQAMAEI